MVGTELKKIETCNLNGIYKDIAEEFGIEIAHMIFRHYKGLQVTFPTRFLSPDYVAERIRCECDGVNHKALARKYQYTERWVREFLKRSSNT